MNLSSLFHSISISLENPFGLQSFLGQNVVVATSEADYLLSNTTDKTVLLAGIPSFDSSESFNTISLDIRKALYGLRSLSVEIIDLGNFVIPTRYEDYVAGITLFIDTVQSLNVRVLFITEDSLPSAVLSALIKNDYRNITCLNNHFRSFEKLQEMTKQGLSLGNFSLLGFQNYLMDTYEESLLDSYAIEMVRLGAISHSLEALEPYMYDADWTHLSLNVVKASDAPAARYGSPNGLSGQTFCQAAYFSGLGGRTHWLSISDILFEKDNGETALLVAQAFWLYLEGWTKHIDEHPFGNNKHIQRFIVINEVYKRHFVFYKSMLSGRWWMEVPDNDSTKIIATSYFDYKLAGKQDIPERWWRFFKRNS